MKLLKLLFVFLITSLSIVNLSSCDSGGYKTYCDSCNKKVTVRMQFHGYKYKNEYGYQVKLWDCWCTECGKYLGVYSGIA